MSGTTSIYCKFGNISGTTTDKNHKNCMDIMAMSWGNNRNIPMNPGSPTREPGQPTFSGLMLTKLVDSSSTELFQRSYGSQTGEEVIVYLANSGDSGAVDYAKFRLEGARISAYTCNGSGDSPAIEFITLAYEELYLEIGDKKAGYKLTTGEKA